MTIPRIQKITTVHGKDNRGGGLKTLTARVRDGDRRGEICLIAESAGPADYPTPVSLNSALVVSLPMMASGAAALSLSTKYTDGNLLARPVTSVTQQLARLISHL